MAKQQTTQTEQAPPGRPQAGTSENHAAQERRIVWLASYPRSGNTFLRSILWHCYHLHTASIYPNDLGGNKALEAFAGHIEHSSGLIKFPLDQRTLPIKTHEHDRDNAPAIYILRDGREAIASLWDFYDRKISMRDLILGRHQFGTWLDHIKSWNFPKRQNTLFLRYEELKKDLDLTFTKLSEFLRQEPFNRELPSRTPMADSDGRWVRHSQNLKKSCLSDSQLALFMEVNGDGLEVGGYA